MKILINTPDYTRPSSGGVASYYNGMLGYWNEDIKYNIIGRRHGISGLFWMPWDVIKFIIRIIIWQPDCVLVNPSLMINALKRDFLFLKIAKCFGCKVVVLIHGFDLNVAMTINHEWVKASLNKASLIMTLADRFRKIMQGWGITAPIELISTKVEDKMLDGFDIASRDGKIKNILFLSRMEKAKGVYETIDTFALLKTRHSYLTLSMVGSGSKLNSLKNYVNSKKIKDVTFTGALNGEERLKAYRDADFFFFFSSYGEGMPTVVLEAMAFGLPIMTRYVGGLCDFFEDGKMGRITDSCNPLDFSAMIEPFINDENYTKEVSLYNHEYALNHFMASKVGRKIEQLLRQYTQ